MLKGSNAYRTFNLHPRAARKRNCHGGARFKHSGPRLFGRRRANTTDGIGVYMKNHPTLIGSLCVATVIATMPTADAASKFDGMWSAVFRTKSGPCQPAYRGAVQVVDGVIQIASTAGSLSGRVSRNGSVSATGYMGANTGVASGRVSGSVGSGTWRAHMAGADCAGAWTAQRR